jgi:hypothetical protein
LDPSLQRIGIALVKLFFFLGAKSLDVRKVAKLFAHGKTKYKTILRKLYTVVAALEIAGIIQRTAAVSSIELKAVVQRQRGGLNQLSVDELLNSPEEISMVQKYERRRKLLEEFA